MPCNRDRKHRFINHLGKIKSVVGNDGVSSVLRDYGLEVFEEWALDLMIADLIQTERSAIKRNRENRAATAAFARRSDQVAALSNLPLLREEV